MKTTLNLDDQLKFHPVVVEGTREPNVDISNRDALYAILDNR